MLPIVGILTLGKRFKCARVFTNIIQDRGRRERIDLDKIEETSNVRLRAANLSAVTPAVRSPGLGDRSKSSAELKSPKPARNFIAENKRSEQCNIPLEFISKHFDAKV